MISIQGLHKRFGHIWILRDINLDIAAGEWLTLFGPNGAGKTTLLRILATLSAPTQGHITIGSYDLAHDAADARRLMGMVAHQPMLYGDLTAEENLRFFARLYDTPQPQARITELLQLVGLETRQADRVRTFSRGMQQRLAIARALLPNPPILLLDEPDDGLDPQAAEQLRTYFTHDASSARTVLMVSHQLTRGLAWADRVAVMVKGRIAYEAQATQTNVMEIERQFGR
jgi:heme exporter protein A